MQLLPSLKERGISVVIGLPQQTPVLEITARLAQRMAVTVIVGGNRFDAHQLSRAVRRHTPAVDQTLARIHLARPFTCFQTITLFEATEPGGALIVIDMLATFYDENISDAESLRLVQLAAGHLRRFGRQAPVLVTLHAPPPPERAGLSKIIRGAADQVSIYTPPSPSAQLPLL